MERTYKNKSSSKGLGKSLSPTYRPSKTVEETEEERIKKIISKVVLMEGEKPSVISDEWIKKVSGYVFETYGPISYSISRMLGDID